MKKCWNCKNTMRLLLVCVLKQCNTMHWKLQLTNDKSCNSDLKKNFHQNLFIYFVNIPVLCFADPPTELKITSSGRDEVKVVLKKGFNEFILEGSAQQYPAIICSSVVVTWASPPKGNIKSCKAGGTDNLTILNHSGIQIVPLNEMPFI